MEFCSKYFSFTAADPCFTLPLPAVALKLTTMDWTRKSPVFLLPRCSGPLHGAQSRSEGGRRAKAGMTFSLVTMDLPPRLLKSPFWVLGTQRARSRVSLSGFWEPCSIPPLPLDLAVARALHSRYS